MDAKFELFRSTINNQYYFRLKSRGNYETILSSEGYETQQGRDNGVNSVRINSQIDSHYERRGGISTFTFVLKSSNGEIIGRSETYASAAGRDNGIAAVKRDAPLAETKYV